MIGEILGSDSENNTWMILGEDNTRYVFSNKNWKERIKPEKNDTVQFDVGENRLVTNVHKISGKTIKNNEQSNVETINNSDTTHNQRTVHSDLSDKYTTKNNDMLIGLLVVGITFFLGFIGTFVSRLVFAKQPIGRTIAPTLIHFIITILIIIPILGWIVYMAGTMYYMYKNYKLVTIDSKN